MDRTHHSRLVLLSICMLVISCGKENQSYFPLDKGLVWLYTIKTQLVLGESTQKRHLFNRGKDTHSDAARYIQESITGTRTYYTDTPEGIKRERIVLPDKQALAHSYINKTVLNYPLEAGTNWQDVMTTSLFANPDSEAHDIIEAIPVDVTIVSINARATVPAGIFNHCIQIKSHGELFIAKGEYAYQHDMHIAVENTRWYAQGIGLVKEEHKEVSDARFFSGGTYTMELEEFNRR